MQLITCSRSQREKKKNYLLKVMQCPQEALNLEHLPPDYVLFTDIILPPEEFYSTYNMAYVPGGES